MQPGMVNGVAEDVDVASAMIEMMGPIAYVIWLMMMLQGSIATGGQALVARANGAKNRDLAERGFGQSVILGFISGCIAGGLIYLCRDAIISVSNISDNAAIFAEQYISIVILSAPLSGVLLVTNSCLRASGDTVRPFYTMCVVNFVNAGASALLVYGPGSIGGHGAQGIAIGTVLGWLSGVVMIMWIIKGRDREYSMDENMVLKFAYIIPNWVLAKRILKISLPNSFELVGMCLIHSVGFILVSNIGERYVQKMGSAGEGAIVGAHAIAVRIESLSFMPAFALGMAAATLAGQYLGAESPNMAKKAVRFCCGVAVITMTTAGVIMYIFAEQIVGLLDVQGSMQGEFAVDLVRIFSFTQPLFAVAMVLKMSMRGVGATTSVMINAYASMILVRIIALGLYTMREDATIQGAWLIVQFDLLFQALVFTYLHFRGKWLKSKV